MCRVSHFLLFVVILMSPFTGFAQEAGTYAEATTTDALSIRSGPGIGYEKFGTLPLGSTVLVIGTNANRMWLQFDYSNQVAWVCAAFTRINGDVSTLPVSDESSQDCAGNEIGSEVQVLDFEAHDEEQARAECESVGRQWDTRDRNCVIRVSQSNSTRELTTGGQAIVVVVRNDSLNVRSGPGTGFDSLARLSAGTVVTILDEPVSSDSYVWWQIRTPDGIEGWAVEAADGIQTLAPVFNENSGFRMSISGEWFQFDPQNPENPGVGEIAFEDDEDVWMWAPLLFNVSGTYSFTNANTLMIELVTTCNEEFVVDPRSCDGLPRHDILTGIIIGDMLITISQDDWVAFYAREPSAVAPAAQPVWSSTSTNSQVRTSDQIPDSSTAPDIHSFTSTAGNFQIPTVPRLSIGGEVVNNFYIGASYIGEDGGVVVEKTQDYQILFSFTDPTYGDDNFTITVLWGDREQSETAFLERLGISQEVACRLNVTVQTFPTPADLLRVGEESSLSFCPEIQPDEDGEYVLRYTYFPGANELVELQISNIEPREDGSISTRVSIYNPTAIAYGVKFEITRGEVAGATVEYLAESSDGLPVLMPNRTQALGQITIYPDSELRITFSKFGFSAQDETYLRRIDALVLMAGLQGIDVFPEGLGQVTLGWLWDNVIESSLLMLTKYRYLNLALEVLELARNNQDAQVDIILDFLEDHPN